MWNMHKDDRLAKKGNFKLLKKREAALMKHFNGMVWVKDV